MRVGVDEPDERWTVPEAVDVLAAFMMVVSLAADPAMQTCIAGASQVQESVAPMGDSVLVGKVSTQ